MRSERPQWALLALVVRRNWRVALAWSLAFALVVLSTISGYVAAYPHAPERLRLAADLARSGGLQAVFGRAHEIGTVAGFTAWRTAAVLPLVAGVWGLLAATRTLRGEEEAGRAEQVLAGALTPLRAAATAIAGLLACAAVVWLGATLALLLDGGLVYGFPLGGTLYLALCLVLPAPLFMAVGALAGELAATRRLAVTIGAAVFGASFVLRVAADSTAALGWLHWLTPLGWVEEMRPLAQNRAPGLILIVLACAVLFGAALVLAGRRDIGAGVLASATEAQPALRLLGSPTALALRNARGGMLGWALGLGAAGLMFGLIAHSVAQIAATSSGLRQTASRWGAVNIATAEGYLGLAFLFVAVAACVYGATQVGATREEESSGRLDTLLCTPVRRSSWLAGRLLVACACVAAAVLSAAVLGWAGAAAQGSHVPLARMLQAALDAFSPAVLFIGVGTLLFALAPRVCATLTLGLVAGTFLLELVGAAVKAPPWLLEVSPFHHLSLAPAAALDGPTTVALLALAVAAASAGVWLFGRRDLAGA
ncbi:MAG TPA: hypothetical protein VID29_10360 [Solirubrobacteraceae bacterium]|jgi:ABC-2 type transport system permease protein